jgi:hypothetical protein
MIDNLLSRIIELRAVINDSETAALDLQMHCVRSLMVCAKYPSRISTEFFARLVGTVLRP